MEFEIGDTFRIDHKLLHSDYGLMKPCNEKYLIFKIKSFSKSGLSVYYMDNRTNKKCKCRVCLDDRKIKSIGIRYIKLHQSNRQRIRNIKLEQIGIYDSLL